MNMRYMSERNDAKSAFWNSLKNTSGFKVTDLRKISFWN